MARPQRNQWAEDIATAAEQAADVVDEWAENLRGGRYPPFVQPLPRVQQLANYELLRLPLALVAPDQQEAVKILRQHYGAWTRKDLFGWAAAMERARHDLVGAAVQAESEEEGDWDLPV